MEWNAAFDREICFTGTTVFPKGKLRAVSRLDGLLDEVLNSVSPLIMCMLITLKNVGSLVRSSTLASCLPSAYSCLQKFKSFALAFKKLLYSVLETMSMIFKN